VEEAAGNAITGRLLVVLLVEHGLELGVDGVGAAAGLDEVRALRTGRRGDDALALVVLDEGCSHAVVGLKALTHSLGLVVVALDEGLASDVVLALDLGGVVVVGIDAAGAGVSPAAGDAADDLLRGHVEVERKVNLDLLLELGGLRHGAGKAVEEDVLVAELGDLGHDHLDDERVGNEAAGVHEGGSLLAERGLLADVGAQDVAGGDVRVVVVLDELLGDSALAATRGTHDDGVDSAVQGSVNAANLGGRTSDAEHFFLRPAYLNNM